MRETEPHHGLSDAPQLIKTLASEGQALVQTELRLAKKELSDGVTQMAGGLAMIGIALIFTLVALSALAVAITLALTLTGLSLMAAAFATCGGFLAVAATLTLIAKSRLKAGTLKPNRALRRIKGDLRALKEVTHGEA